MELPFFICDPREINLHDNLNSFTLLCVYVFVRRKKEQYLEFYDC
jgi:hypothetical protein